MLKDCVKLPLFIPKPVENSISRHKKAKNTRKVFNIINR